MVIAVVMTSCEEYDGRWKPIEVDKSQLSFTPEGGEQTITVLNYNRWWISGGYEDYDKATVLMTVGNASTQIEINQQ